MIRRIPAYDPDAPVIVVDIGNTDTTLATWHKDQLRATLSVLTQDERAFHDAYQGHVDAAPNKTVGATVVGSVVPDALERVCEYMRGRQEMDALVVGATIPWPIDVGVTDQKAVGADRVCAAGAAFERLQSSCTVIDFGTAVTVDLVDGDGTFRGGAILPGLRMQLRALNHYTALLPEVEPGIPELFYGRNTTEAIQTGVCRGLAGAVRAIVEGYAASLNHWPQVVATGGDMPFMTPHCDFLDTSIEHLVLAGIALAYTKHVEAMGG